MALESRRRSFSEELKRSKLKDVDSADRVQKFRARVAAIFLGGGLGGLLGFLLGHPILGLLLGPVLVYSVVMGVANSAGKGAEVLYMPSGSSTPRKQEYSRAKSLEVRGEYVEAVRAYEVAILDAPKVGEPYLRIARLFRDELKELDLAVHWFRRAQREAGFSPGEAIRTHRELAEIFLHARREPRRAAPELARLAENFPDTPDGKWAAKELAEIKEELDQERRGEGTTSSSASEDIS
jgi:tetratricopeptide (TPR) repeat protein